MEVKRRGKINSRIIISRERDEAAASVSEKGKARSEERQRYSVGNQRRKVGGLAKQAVQLESIDHAK